MNIAQVPSAELARRLETEAGVEWVNGKIIEKSTSTQSSAIEARLISLLLISAGQDSAHVFPPSMGYRCFAGNPENIRKPDVPLVEKHRLGRIDPNSAFVPIPPDLAIEVLTQGDLQSDLDDRIDDYLRNGFKLIGIVHPTTRTVSIYRADGSVAVLRDSDEITGETALATFRCKIAEFFVSLS